MRVALASTSPTRSPSVAITSTPTLIWSITRSAADLPTSDEQRQLVRECGAPDCLWLFVDTTKNRSRQWCSMQSCGNREKARRHYQRMRERRDISPGAAADAPRGRG